MKNEKFFINSKKYLTNLIYMIKFAKIFKIL